MTRVPAFGARPSVEAIESEAPSSAPASTDDLPSLGREVWIAAAVVSLILIAVSTRYGYHRDELYFLVAGRHLAWAYPDQPSLVPFVARVLSVIAPGSLLVLRLPSALAAGAVVVLTGLIAREMKADRWAQLLAAVGMATAGFLSGSLHYLNTSGFNLLAWTVLLWLVVRYLRTGDTRLWLAIGLVTGVVLFNSDLPAVLLLGVVAGIALCGPRRTFSSPWPWIGGVVAALLWLPYLLWQAHHGWPQLTVGRAIASGSSTTSTPRYLLLPEQFLLVSPYFSPVWIGGLVRTFRRGTLAWCRPVGVAYVVVAAVFLVTGGKSYYLVCFLPVLLAAGAGPVVDWARRGRAAARRWAIIVGAAVSAVVTVFLSLPLLPASVLHRTFISAVNPDMAETVAWPTYVAEIAAVYRSIPPNERAATVILTHNYGEAGAVDRFGPKLGLPQAYSGQNGFWYWGPPPAGAHAVLVVGYNRQRIDTWFTGCDFGTELNNHLHLDADEQGVPVWRCTGLRRPWATLWPEMKHLG